MAVDRVGELIGDTKRRHRQLVSPEGVALDVQVAGLGERGGALLIDIAFMYGAIIAVFVVVSLFAWASMRLSVTLALSVAFVIRNAYFMHFELSSQGRTPGKKLCGLRVINRAGGELTPSAVIARNLTREIEFFTPISLVLIVLTQSRDMGWQVALLGWVGLVASLPLWNPDRLRAGDLIAGTMVIAMPRLRLDYDLSDTVASDAPATYRFTAEQLSIYGAFELQVLEELLRQPRTPASRKQLEAAYEKICKKIDWTETIPPVSVRAFLTEFYAAERASLERGQLFGNFRADQKARGQTRKRKKT